jgi:oxygen-independent coproporphyrinogen-3 oxidase
MMTALIAPGRRRLEALPPLSLYVHVPWCVKKCPYCDFNSHALRATVGGSAPSAADRAPAEQDAYVAALAADLEAALPLVWGRPVLSVFLGGGTPSLFSASAIDRILTHVRSVLPLAADAEITLEANPGTFEQARFAGFRAAGVNRLSLGVQSFNGRHLEALGRVHDPDEARAAAQFARATFANLNLDLMYALPEQALADALADLEQAIDLAPDHLSVYHLTVEPNTAFHAAPPPLPDDDLSADMQQALERRLAEAGYVHYETSAFARPGARARHNLNYWQFGDYLGIGAGAHSKLSFEHRIIRQMRHRHPRTYLAEATAGRAVAEEKVVADSDLAFEFAMNSLRLREGFSYSDFEARTGLARLALLPALDRAEALGLIDRDAFGARPSARGRLMLNNLLECFL